MPELSPALFAPLAGFAGGIVLGLAARIGRFCTLAAMEDMLFADETRRWRMWCLAMAVAIIGVALVQMAGLVDFETSIYVTQPVNLIAAILGGLAFGIGMALVGTCGYGTLARIGGGDLRAFTVFLVFAVSAAMAMGGPTADLRAWLIDPLALPPDVLEARTLTGAVANAFALPKSEVAGPLAIIVAGLIIWWCYSDQGFRSNPSAQFWGAVVGLTIVYGWLATGYFAADEFNPRPAGSFTFSAPLGDTLIYLMTTTAGAPTFGVGATAGVVTGAAIGAFKKREFRWDASDDAIELRRHIIGAFLMGTGSVFALGCTIGQGLTGVSVLALTAPLVLASMWAGAFLGLTYLFEGSVTAAAAHILKLRAPN